MEYLLYFLVTIFLSTIFAMAGLGSAIALVPAFNFLGLSFDISRASGLFVNFVTTVTTSFLNFKKKLFDKDFVFPLILSSMIFAYIGAKTSFSIDVDIVKNIFAITLVFIASAILFLKKDNVKKTKVNKNTLYFVGSIGGFFSGLLGIGGGSIISPILVLLGYDLKKIAISISFVIPFSSIVAFSSYISNIQMDYVLLVIISLGAYIGGVIGNYLLHFKISSKTIKKIIAIVLYIIAIKIFLIG